MTCKLCRSWAATTERQWRNRQRNMAANPEVSVHLCPYCESAEWATTREMIGPEPAPPWWRRLLAWVARRTP